MSRTDVWTELWTGAHFATMDADRQEAYGAIPNGAMALSGDQIVWIGEERRLPAYDADQLTIIDCGHKWITPGLIDCHTHLIHGGDRAEEFELRLTGVSYDEIARRGGGIRSTVSATRVSSEQQLFEDAAARLRDLIAEGVTGIEIKSGYGLDRDTEFKMLRVAQRLGVELPVDVARTYLGAHALPPEYDDADAYIDLVCREVMPEMAEHGLADAVDVFCEHIAFDLDQCERVFTTARDLDLPVKAHAEQLSNMGGAALAAGFGALSADHLEYLDEAGVNALQAAGSVAVLLPGAYYFLNETRLPPIELLRNADVPIAIASDNNPGSSPVNSLLLILNMACTLFALTPEEALAGVTRQAARALGWEDRLGSLTPGRRADFVVWDIDHPRELAYRVGHNPSRLVVKGGERVLDRGFQGSR